MSDQELEMFKEWEIELIRQTSFYDGPVEPDAGRQREQRIFEDHIEDWELNAADGSGPGPRIALGVVKRNAGAKFRLQEKYKGFFFVDKDPDGDAGYYNAGGGAPLPKEDWEHRKIMGLVWENHRGFRLETKLCNNLTGPAANYIVNESMIRMIKESNRNRFVRFRSDM